MLVSIKRYMKHHGYIPSEAEEVIVIAKGELLGLDLAPKGLFKVHLRIDKVHKSLRLAVNRPSPIVAITDQKDTQLIPKVFLRESFKHGNIIINDNNDTKYLKAVSALTGVSKSKLLIQEITDYVFNKPNT